MPEIIPDLAQVLQWFEQGKYAHALERIDALLDTDATLELYSLRLKILLQDAKNTPAIADTLLWMKKHISDEELTPVIAQVGTVVETEVETLYNQLDLPNMSYPFHRVDELTWLADWCPAIYTLHAAVNLHLAFAQNKDHSAYSAQHLQRLQHVIEQYIQTSKRHSSPPLQRFALDKAVWAAGDSLTKAMSLLPVSHPFYAISMKLMGQWKELQGEVEEAMDFYHQASRLALPVNDYIEAIKYRVAERLLPRLLEQLDSLLLAGDYTSAVELLNCAVAFDGLADIHVRWGDLAYGIEDYSRAEVSYHQALHTAPIDREQFLHGIDPDSLSLLRERLRTLGSKPFRRPKRNDATTLVRRFPMDDVHHRSTVGLVLTYQATGKSSEAQPYLRELLIARDLPEEVYPHLIRLADRNESLMQEEHCDQLRREARQQVDEGNWDAALTTLYNLCSQPTAKPEDSAWLAVALLQTGQSKTVLVHVLADLNPTDLSGLPRNLVYELLDQLCDENQWDVATKYVSGLKLSATWRKKFQSRLDAFVQLRTGDLRWLLDEKQLEEADILADQLLLIAPDRPDLQILRAKVHIALNQLVEAQSILHRMSHVEQAKHDVGLALVEIDLRRGYYVDAERRLEKLADADDLTFMAIRDALQNRIRRVPAIYTGHSESHVAMDSLRRVQGRTHFAIFGVEIASARAGQNLPSSLESCSQFLMAAGQADRGGLNVQYAWRYITSQGKLSITLLCRTEADSAVVAETGAMNLWHSLKNVLPQQNEIFAYAPIPDLTELRRILAPFEIRWAAEVARKEATVPKPDGQEIYLVYPFNYGKGDLGRTLQLMLEQREPVTLDIHFAPTNLFPWERAAITDMIGRERNNQLYDVLPQLAEADRPVSDFRQRWISDFYPQFLEKTRMLAFVGQIQLAARGQVDPSLLSLASMDLFGTSDFDVMGALSECDLETVGRNLSEVTPERWIYTDAPEAVSRWRHLFTPDETLAAVRLPTPGGNGLPGLPSIKVRMLPMPETFVRGGILLGESAFPVNGRMVQVTADIEDRLKHTYIVGRTGSGKSTLIQNMALQDIEAGLGVGVIDPHGDLIEAILERIPPHRAGDVVVFDPSDQQRPVALNIMDVEGTFERNMVIADFLGLLQSMFDPNYHGFVGPRFENIVRQSMLALMEVVKGTTLIDVVRMISDKDFREDVIKGVRDPVVANYWNNVGKQLDSFGWGSAKGEMVDWLMSKFGRFVDDNMMRYIIGQSRNTIDFEAIMNNRQILLVDLSKGKIGPQNSKFLGLLLVPRLLIAAHRRARLKPDERDPFCLYVDEFQNFTTPSFVEMLSEARKYGVALTMANQFTNQLEPAIREAVFGNVGSLLVFQVGLKDAMLLNPELYPLNADDIINMPNYHLFAKMLIEGQVTSPFPVHTLADTRVPNPAFAENIRQTSRLRYGRDLGVVQMEIERRFKGKL